MAPPFIDANKYIYEPVFIKPTFLPNEIVSLKEAIKTSLQYNTILQKFFHNCNNEQQKESQMSQIIFEYTRLLWICSQIDFYVAPSITINEIWIIHLQDTEAYSNFCLRNFRRIIFHKYHMIIFSLISSEMFQQSIPLFGSINRRCWHFPYFCHR